jgi:O-antigen/teichoic acid export membrane protein
MVVVLAVLGGPMLHLWTSGKVGPSGLLLDLFLLTTVIDALWYTSLTVLYATNRHQRAAVWYALVSLIGLPVAYGLMQLWGLDGAATTLLIADVVMLYPVLRQAVPAAHDDLRQWLAAVIRPPMWIGVILHTRPRSRPA